MIKREGLQYEEHEKRHRQLGHRKRKGLQRAFGDRKGQDTTNRSSDQRTQASDLSTAPLTGDAATALA
jgi:hypothetical protein